MTTAALNGPHSSGRHRGLPCEIRRTMSWVAAVAALLTSLRALPDTRAATAQSVDGKALLAAAENRADWLTHGRTYDEQRFAPLDQINTGNVRHLGLAWFADLDTARGQEATPLVIDGTIYITTAWSVVKAYDAVSGRLRWEYDPKVPRETGGRVCCDVVKILVADGAVVEYGQALARVARGVPRG
jgi:quinohemoprotein ethanol dehydrogenase